MYWLHIVLMPAYKVTDFASYCSRSTSLKVASLGGDQIAYMVVCKATAAMSCIRA